MPRLDGDAAATSEPAFPYWPFSCLAFYSHVARDLGRYAQTLADVDDPARTVEAEETFSMILFKDIMQGYVDLTLTPLNAMAAVMTGEPFPPRGGQGSDGPARDGEDDKPVRAAN